MACGGGPPLARGDDVAITGTPAPAAVALAVDVVPLFPMGPPRGDAVDGDWSVRYACVGEYIMGGGGAAP